MNCILTGSETGPDGNTDMTFFLDGSAVGSFKRQPDGDTSHSFNQTVFSMENLTNTAHSLQILVGLGGQKALILLSSIVYTTDGTIRDSNTSSGGTLPNKGTSSSHTHIGVIVGGLIGGLATINTVVIILYKRGWRVYTRTVSE